MHNQNIPHSYKLFTESFEYLEMKAKLEEKARNADKNKFEEISKVLGLDLSKCTKADIPQILKKYMIQFSKFYGEMSRVEKISYLAYIVEPNYSSAYKAMERDALKALNNLIKN